MISIETIPETRLKKLPASMQNVPFGTLFTDRMFKAVYREGVWQNYQIVPFAPITLSPAALVFHYAQAIFEGLKAYSLGEEVYLFRPEMNAKRFKESAIRMCIPPFPEKDFVDAIQQLVALEKRWIPRERGASLYIRPIIMGVEPSVKVKPSSEFWFFVLLSPVGPYFPSGFKAVKILIQDKYHRACRGGTGFAKAAGNYGGSLYATQLAKEQFSCEQVLWLDAQDEKWIEEVGAMNIWFVEDHKKLVTPPLSGTILPGVVRDSLLKFGRYLGYETEERPLSIEEVLQNVKSGKITEIFGSGTAAVISSVGTLIYKGEYFKVGEGESGPVAAHLFKSLTELQYGLTEDPFHWRIPV
jgi:branched-chain amino acid aminotransferase